MSSSKTFLDVEIHIKKLTENGYPIELTLNQNEQQFRGGYLPADIVDWQSTASLVADGQQLLAYLLIDPETAAAWHQIKGQSQRRRIRLRIDADAPELHVLPWEALHDEQNSVAASAMTPFSRYLAGKWPVNIPLTTRPLKMLVVIANPTNLADYKLTPIKVSTEEQLLETAFDDLTIGQVERTYLSKPITLTRLEAALNKGYDLLHIICHGAFSTRRNQAVLYLADNANRVKLARDTDLTAMLSRLSFLPRLIFLASCQTANQTPADAFRGLAPQLVKAGIPTVLAMQDLVPVKTAQTFSQTFYRELFSHGQIDLASNQARSAVLTAGLPGSAIPVLFSRLPKNQLLTIPTGDSLPIITRKPFEPETIYIPAGSFLMGSDRKQVELPAYRIGRYPVTNVEFAAFIAATGDVITSLRWPGQKPAPEQNMLPVTGINWYLAVKYCQWLSEQTGRAYSLPSETQWEKAAAGTKGLSYPWGETWQENRANPNPNQITAVNLYDAQNEYGCYDLVGNLREWTTSLWGTNPREPEPEYDGRNDLTVNSQVRRIYRGGATNTPNTMTCQIRQAAMPKTNFRLNQHGLRVVMQINTV
ncbi:SUMF1/EgtB/PvdO family nonheme iron enzyme [Anaerolineales bacterium HSG25]|nr:SUMF1/EgtB/PvdO family nonheme iron enzyme [Anaerolineales bacterium HSG25]